jgi:ATP-dependent helicase/nuclease subunit B
VHARFLLGPAGSGKTYRCLAEVRAALANAPDGPPLVLLAPKQATFQLERQLLEGDLAGFTRLRVLSFDRLAQFVFEQLKVAPPRLLSAEGRLMVLRALLWRHDRELKLMRGSARRPGFAQELAGQLAELDQYQFGPARLRALAADETLRPDLRAKLADLALISEKYGAWMNEHALQDAGRLLDFATQRLRGEPRPRESTLAIQHLWLDGFAEMTPQEHALLAAVIPFCGSATLAFCLETEPTPPASWLSIWSAIGKTFQRCRDQLASLPSCVIETETLARVPGRNRFAEHSPLAALEASWALPIAAEPADVAESAPTSQISVTACAQPEAEASLAARELLKFVRAGNRFRDCAVLVRNLETYHGPLARSFRKYEIPFFLDRREPVAHHPLAELTRSALRTVAHDWPADDWFAALKAGFTPVADEEIDRLENAALEFGWHGQRWHAPLPDAPCERLRKIIFPPYERLLRRLSRHKLAPTGPQLAEAIREFWGAMKVEPTLAEWALPTANPTETAAQITVHHTVFVQMTSWLENIALAFPREPLPLADWLPILETGLAGVTVGVIPPTLDEVLVGAVDRARSPYLKFVLLLGMNESVFPAPPPAPVILTHSDREELTRQNSPLGPDVLDQISRERYLGYIACTRASEKLALLYSRQDVNGRALVPSPFIAHARRHFPQLPADDFSEATDWGAAEHCVELTAALVGRDRPASANRLPAEVWEIPAVQRLAERLGRLREPDSREPLAPPLAEELYGPVLKGSVSRLEEFAQCPFRFFVSSGLRAGERRRFELDSRERGSFQHLILERFHNELRAEQKRWRDLDPAAARERIGRIAAELAPNYRDGLLQVDAKSRFAAQALTAALQEFIAVLITWMREQYDFEPALAETAFGLDEAGLPAWRIELPNGHALALRGRVDRVDVCRSADSALFVVMDYKSSARKLDDALVAHGVQLQLLAYLAAVRRWPASLLGVDAIRPAGAFYVNLRGQAPGSGSRAEVLKGADAARRLAYRHSGRFDFAALDQLDRARAADQFNYRLKENGELRAGSTEALACKEFAALLDQTEDRLRALGAEIYSGAASVDPYRKGNTTACDYCEYRAICRIDPTVHEFRELAEPKP